ncbi:hypothetical protein PanWU01x14_356290 [Parasponia andersonii]|uniref:Uncharacterized protein n=1 Tax=Parasponia andersonii TaxID=3476 RepID=A0A2P5A901_PARAD|nr:hypothetical protein PanWU01x14_356290 [Parasponia andersonii]
MKEVITTRNLFSFSEKMMIPSSLEFRILISTKHAHLIKYRKLASCTEKKQEEQVGVFAIGFVGLHL